MDRTLFFCLVFLVFEHQAHSQHASIEKVVCTGNMTVDVRADDLTRILYRAENLQTVKVFQGWGETNKETTTDGKSITYIKIQFRDDESKIGWVPSQSVRFRDQCPAQITSPANLDDQSVQIITQAGDLNDPKCCQFPLPTKPKADYTTGMRRFGASRSGDRLHAACDLYKDQSSPILAVSDGVVIADLYRFYEGTFALEVKHSAGFVVRYGEVTGKAAKGISLGKKVITGQQVGYMGKVNSGCCEPMLHFELFSGRAKGSLTSGGLYRRRSDLLNPTPYLQNWEKH